MTHFAVFRLKLKEWANKEEVGTRFPKLGLREYHITCPKCASSDLLEDEWPPNYWSGSTGGRESEFSGSTKVICPHCSIHFGVQYYTKTRNDLVTQRHTAYSEPVDLVEFRGLLLTPNDVYCEEYKNEHGEYPKQIYG